MCIPLQALADAETSVIAEAVRFLTAVCHERQIRKPALLAAAHKVRCLPPAHFKTVAQLPFISSLQFCSQMQRYYLLRLVCTAIGLLH